jgi:hypothetical protein
MFDRDAYLVEPEAWAVTNTVPGSFGLGSALQLPMYTFPPSLNSHFIDRNNFTVGHRSKESHYHVHHSIPLYRIFPEAPRTVNSKNKSDFRKFSGGADKNRLEGPQTLFAGAIVRRGGNRGLKALLEDFITFPFFTNGSFPIKFRARPKSFSRAFRNTVD